MEPSKVSGITKVTDLVGWEKLWEWGKLEQVCSSCGQTEAAGSFCSACGFPTTPDDFIMGRRSGKKEGSDGDNEIV